MAHVILMLNRAFIFQYQSNFEGCGLFLFISITYKTFEVGAALINFGADPSFLALIFKKDLDIKMRAPAFASL